MGLSRREVTAHQFQCLARPCPPREGKAWKNRWRQLPKLPKIFQVLQGTFIYFAEPQSLKDRRSKKTALALITNGGQGIQPTHLQAMTSNPAPSDRWQCQ